MCTLYDNTWDLALRWAALAVIALALAWAGYRSGAFSTLLRRRTSDGIDADELRALLPADGETPQAA